MFRAGMALVAAAVFAIGLQASHDDQKNGDKAVAGSHEQCAKACSKCMRECESCASYCAHHVSEGHKEHLKTLGTCADCAEICASAAKIVSRHGPMAVTICQCCAKACEECGQACEKFSADEQMSRCAKACRDCAAACNDMIKHSEHHNARDQ
jgi:hypothetical protein